MPIGYPGNAITKEARAKAGGGFESAIENAAPAAQRVISGTGFGTGPNVILFDRFGGVDRTVISGTRSADIGQWAAKIQDGAYDTKFYADRGRTWFAHRDPSALGVNVPADVSLFFDMGGNFSEFRYAQRRWVPTDRHFPGATAPGEFDTSGAASSWKPAWIAGSAGTDLAGRESNDGQADLVFDSHISTGSMRTTGNSVNPNSLAGGNFFAPFSFTSPTLTSWYQSGAESAENANDATVDFITSNDAAGTGREVRDDVDTFGVNADTWSTMTKSYAGLLLGGLITNGSPYDNCMPLLADVYLAVGPNSRASIYTGNAATLSACTELYLVPPDSGGWTDTKITFSLEERENLTYTHLILADGTLVENAEGV